MKCFLCHAPARVIDSKATDDGAGVRRRYKCTVCGHRFNTVEQSEDLAAALARVRRALDEAQQALAPAAPPAIAAPTPAAGPDFSHIRKRRA